MSPRAPDFEDAENQAVSPARARSPVGWRLGVIADLVAELETATVAGQHYVMDKMVALLREEANGSSPSLSQLEQKLALRAIEDLDREQHRRLPDLEKLVTRARAIAHMLSRR